MESNTSASTQPTGKPTPRVSASQSKKVITSKQAAGASNGKPTASKVSAFEARRGVVESADVFVVVDKPTQDLKKAKRRFEPNAMGTSEDSSCKKPRTEKPEASKRVRDITITDMVKTAIRTTMAKTDPWLAGERVVAVSCL